MDVKAVAKRIVAELPEFLVTVNEGAAAEEIIVLILDEVLTATVSSLDWDTVALAQLHDQATMEPHPPICIGGPFNDQTPSWAMLWKDTLWIPSGRGNEVYRVAGREAFYLGIRRFGEVRPALVSPP